MSYYIDVARGHSWSSNPRPIADVSQICINIGVIVSIVKMHLLIDPVTVIFDLSTPKPRHF